MFNTVSKHGNKSFLTILLAIIMCIVAALGVVGCGKDDDTGGGDTGNGDNPGGGNVDIGGGGSDFDDGTHDNDITDKEGFFLVKDGKTDYKIVTAVNPTEREISAVGELSNFFELATGIVLERISDEGLTLSDTSKYISIGHTAILQQAKVDVSLDTLGKSGVKIVTKGESLFLSGAEDYGTLYSVYEFLKHIINFEVYSDNIIVHDTNVAQIPLKNYNITEVPDFQFNIASHNYISRNSDLKNRFRIIALQEQTISKTGNIYHNTLEWLPKSTYGEHTNWYSTLGNNLCYYARGNEAELELLKQETTNLMKEAIIKNPNNEYIAFGHEDTQTLCECTKCKAERAKYGTDAAGVVLFLNDVRARLQEWFDNERSDLDFGQKILFFAYHATNKPPVNYDAASGEYTPMDDKFVCKDIVPWFAETNGDYTVSLLETDINKPIADNMKGWKALTNEILFWTYGTNFSFYLTPYNSFNGFQETYKFAASQGVKSLYSQHQTNNENSTGFERLKGYLNYKLGWNVNLDVTELTDNFFDAYFGPASDAMMKFYDEVRILGQRQIESGYKGTRSIFHNALQTKYWPKNLLENWLGYVDEALLAIEPLKEENPDLYNSYYFNIALERVAPSYLMAELYQATISSQRLLELRLQVKTDVSLTGITLFQERQGEIDKLFTRWGV